MNSLTNSTTGELIQFRDFDKEIECYLETKIHLSHKLINQSDIPMVVDALREFLIRNAGPLTIIGFYRPTDLSIWYDGDALREEFDGLLLLFRDYLPSKGVEKDKLYTLHRYRDNLHFFMVEGDGVDNDIPPSFPDEDETTRQELNELEGFFVVLEQRLEEKVGHFVDVGSLMKDLVKEGDLKALLEKHRNY